MLEYQGAMGLPLGRYAWWEVERMFLGWRRQEDITASRIWCAILAVAGASVDPAPHWPLVPRTKPDTQANEAMSNIGFGLLARQYGGDR